VEAPSQPPRWPRRRRRARAAAGGVDQDALDWRARAYARSSPSNRPAGTQPNPPPRAAQNARGALPRSSLLQSTQPPAAEPDQNLRGGGGGGPVCTLPEQAAAARQQRQSELQAQNSCQTDLNRGPNPALLFPAPGQPAHRAEAAQTQLGQFDASQLVAEGWPPEGAGGPVRVDRVA